MGNQDAGQASGRPFLSLTDERTIQLDAQGGMLKAAHILDEDSIRAVNAALAARRPLLVRGEPGTGKSQLARAAAKKLGRPFVYHAVDSRTEAHDLLYSVDSVARLAEAQVMGATHGITAKEARKRIDVRKFLRPGALWWAFDWASAEGQTKDVETTEDRSDKEIAEAVQAWTPHKPKGWSPNQGVVVLIDEIDKADMSIPNGLLDAFGHGRFDVPGRGVVAMNEGVKEPLVVITTNEERALPDAFVRRCLVLHLEMPDSVDGFVKLGKAHFEGHEKVLLKAAEQIIHDREKLGDRGPSRPGLAEYIDLVRAVVEQGGTEDEQVELLGLISKFTFQKHGDLEK